METKLKVALLANTGLGNIVLKALKKNELVLIDSVVTRKLDGKFPYFDTEELHDLADLLDVKCFCNIDVNTEYYEYLKNREVDLIIVASFNQIIKKNLIDLPKKGIVNYHPSLLPHYRGPSPLIWSLLNEEKETGLSVHRLTTKLDGGDLLFQKTIIIEDCDNLGTLFKKEADECDEITSEVINYFQENNTNIIVQNENEATYYSRPQNRTVTLDMGFNRIVSIIKAFHPYPKAILEKDGKKFIIDDYKLIEDDEIFKDNFIAVMENDSSIKLKLISIEI